ncbi:hydroxyacid dehydrogenase [Streptomyces sp. ZAF1911]|uniref:hydroxyacid dehydrogenase n=1 Tax=Streptomyces sp. ZAF1911 TaxID=2944129 RepID=UPI00237ABA00|nr:hydroxyacid dehydrogenase [Streptomyces sp. ZAF1911]MDD9375812.1 hydroxyacid dehydrogenase [Streptomyces sp. ZAF1911]
MTRPRVLLAMAPDLAPSLLDEGALDRLVQVAELDPGLVIDDFGRADAIRALRDAELLLTFWGCPQIDASVLELAPHLTAVVHAAGSVRWHVTEACWERGIRVSSAAAANSLPVAEFTVAAILFSNKRVLEVREEYRRVRGAQDWRALFPDVGNYHRTVGIVGASHIGRRVIELLAPYSFDVLLHDPYLSDTEAQRLGARLVGLDALCAVSDVVSLHAPELPATRHLIDRRRLGLMRDGATLVNTARGSLVDQTALTAELTAGRLSAVLDTTEPECPPADSPLYDLPNVLLTPHFAGSFGTELRRMAEHAVEEVARYAAGLPFAHPVRREELDRIA